MKIKLLRSIVPLLSAFLLATALVSFPTDKIFGRFYQKAITPAAKAKMYNFLLTEKRMYFKMGEEISEAPLLDRVGIIEQFHKSREKMDTSEMPADFQYAWEKLTVSDLQWVGLIYHLRSVNKDGQTIIRTNAQKEIVDKQIAENYQLRGEFISIARSYGIKFDKNQNLIEENAE